ncbi:hypothetical protein CHGG_03474 [Chaetomium globosum CBS 148.51]|uniref:NACHT domain-containing protein n=1 Tax=Chaetomium globosum (strain ATCC 6205 / CBS 148.51 / DSM 1962 / NBRC 6347 / NRRL 1970) TaxID=306901 RepID=Q2H8I0_CHAGB|nr:uncharacterized protein CHGG_03474 [Chaetomium globosum CBS 148.51]EAQ91539.1 hypothetical protein CHGG_03474 [Chaetomium globosum CBS 148.51]
MEALASIGAASSILQLLDFTIKLIKAGKEVRESGCTLQNEALESIYERMQTFLTPVAAIASTPITMRFSSEITSSARCALQDCREVLSYLRELKIKNGGRKTLGSVIVAFRSILKRRKIGEIEGRLKMRLNAISLEMSQTACLEIQRLRAETNSLAVNGRLAADRDFNMLLKRLEDLHMEVKDAEQPKKVKTLCQVAKQLKEQTETFSLMWLNDKFLNSLSFRCRDRRHEAIPDNYTNTFKWIYDIPHFRDWMEHGSGIFWIHAKPGAGKSTLMKFLADNAQTQEHLDVWAAPSKTTIAAHYFWNQGSPMQKSMLGLLQTLVSEILHKAPHLVPLAIHSLQALIAPADEPVDFSNLDHAHAVRICGRLGLRGSHVWTMKTLSWILQSLAQSDTGNVKLCLFVDGLDEFEGNHQEVCAILGSLGASRHIKLCVSNLGDLFKHILHRIDSVYAQKSAELLQIALHDDISAKLPPEAYYYHEQNSEQDDPTVMGPVGNLSVEELWSTRQLASRRITALIGDLLEDNFHGPFAAPTVESLHRTVDDFLRTEGITKDIRSRTGPEFDVHLALTKLNAILIRSASSSDYEDRIWSLKRVSAIMNDNIPQVSEGYNTRLAYRYLDVIDHHIAGCSEVEFDLLDFRTTLLESRLFEYVSEKVSRNNRYFLDVDIDPEDTLRDAEDRSAASTMLRIIVSHSCVSMSGKSVESPAR